MLMPYSRRTGKNIPYHILHIQINPLARFLIKVKWRSISQGSNKK